jgi:hypothetical protein
VGKETCLSCDTLLLSVGLIPENELSRHAGVLIDPLTGGPLVNQWMQSSLPAIFATGNVVHVNDLADNVSLESQTAGRCAALYARGALPQPGCSIPVIAGENVRYVCPQKIAIPSASPSASPSPSAEIEVSFRVTEPLWDARILACSGTVTLSSKKAKRANPGEMESIRIPLSGLDNSSDTVMIEVKGYGADE